MDIEQWLLATRKLIDQWIDQDLPEDQAQPGSVEEAMRYSLLAGGKRLRPQLVLASGMYLGKPPEYFKEVALAVEYLHTYSLIHDDLPAMDNDDLRRGVPTSHKVFGEAMAILAGDGLLTEAFAKMGRVAHNEITAEKVVNSIYLLAEAAGRKGLIQGQVKDLAAEHQQLTVEELADIHRRKTGALFVAALRIPAMLVGEEDMEQRLAEFGIHFGLAFQITDDILNVTGDRHKLGKATGTDAVLGKATYPRLLGMEEAKRLAKWHQAAAKESLGNRENAQVLMDLLNFAINRQW